MPVNIGETVIHFQTSKSSTVKLFEQLLVKTFTGNLLTLWFRSLNTAYHLLCGVLMYSNSCSYCGTETKGLLYPRQKRLGDLLIVWLAMDGWITARAVMSFQSTRVCVCVCF